MLTFKFILYIIEKVKGVLMDILNKPRKQKRMVDGLKQGLEQAVVMSKEAEELSLGSQGELLIDSNELVEMSHIALGTYQDSSGQTVLIKIPFNSAVGVVGEIETLLVGSRSDVTDRFKIEAVNNKII